MNKIKLIPGVIVFTLLFGNALLAQRNTKDSSNKGFAVLELFTSEGCSSCPPADELMGRIQQEYLDDSVFVLCYHVDYWDQQGWKDIFSNPDYTKRQYDYAKWLDREPIYTPQLIINGSSEFIGSQEAAVEEALKKALSKSIVVELSLKGTELNNKLNINYSVMGSSKSEQLLFSVVQKSAKSDVKRGENAHRVLNHFQIVLHLQTTNIMEDGEGSTTMHLPKEFNTKDFEIIGFVQNKNTGVILGASKVAF